MVEREREREKERERDRLRIRIIFALIKAFRFPGNSLSSCDTNEGCLSLPRVVFSRWSRRKKEREQCARREEENDFKNKRDDTERRL